MAQLKDTTITGGLSVSGTVNITGATQTNNDVTLYKSTGDSPSIIFQRGTLGDTLNDYKITDVGGYLKIKQQGNSSTSGFTQVAELTNQGTFTVSTPPATDTTPSVTAWISPTDSSVKISTDATIASGDKLVIRDSSDSNKMRSSSISFGSSTTTYLRNDGTWGTPSGGGGGGVTPSDIVVKGYDETGETTLYTGNLGSGLAVIEPLILDSSAVSELAIEHKNSGVTAGAYLPSWYTSKDTILYIPTFSVDSAGHITTASNVGFTVPLAKNSSASSSMGLMAYSEYYNLAYNLDYKYSHYVGNSNGGLFYITAGNSSKTVNISFTTGGISSTSWDTTGVSISNSLTGNYIQILGVDAVLVNSSTSVREPVLVDWSVTNTSTGTSPSSGVSVTVSTADPVPTGYTLGFKILYSLTYSGH